mmetsp:Transcript_32265/g.70395  ORF Transcript_32265/g.70395 Transcript_32265/m.70395 type:complete len:220 (-) Transcript_32265:404-1063(-)
MVVPSPGITLAGSPSRDDASGCLVRYNIAGQGTISVTLASTADDHATVMQLLGGQLAADRPSSRMLYLLARHESQGGKPIGCLMATLATQMISSCIYDYEEPSEVRLIDIQERTELWGLQIPTLEGAPDRLLLSLSLLYAHCLYSKQNGIRCGFCVPRPQLLEKWRGVGVPVRPVPGGMALIYPQYAHDYEYYRTSTVAFFLVDEMLEVMADAFRSCGS